MLLSTRTKTIIGSCLVVGALAAAPATISPAGAGEPAGGVTPFTIHACTSTKPCITWKNNGSGAGLKSWSTGGNGLVGVTNHQALGATWAGVLGVDFVGSETNAGVEGTSDRGYGVLGITNSNGGNGNALMGIVTGNSGDGGDGVVGTTPLGYGVLGMASYGSGVVGETGDPDSAAIYGTNANGVGILGSAPTDVAVEAVGGYVLPNNGLRYPALLANYTGTSPGDVVEAETHFTQVLALDDSGNLRITGLLYTAGSCASGCSKGRTVKRVVSYAPSESQPTMEDFGKGQLVDGRAGVHLDPSFANVIDQHSDYLVFITPEGDSRGLYVTDKTPSGFSVRENQGGRSTLAFDYRIVAKPYADASKRLPMIELPPVHVVKHNPRVKAPRLPGSLGALALP